MKDFFRRFQITQHLTDKEDWIEGMINFIAIVAIIMVAVYKTLFSDL